MKAVFGKHRKNQILIQRILCYAPPLKVLHINDVDRGSPQSEQQELVKHAWGNP